MGLAEAARYVFAVDRRKSSRLGRLVRLLALVALAVGGLLAYQIWSFQAVRDETTADAAVVMGAAVWGSEPSPAFAARIEHAIDLYQRGRVGQIVFTGGVGEGKRFAEAEVAKRHATERGVRPDHILVEAQSRTTLENLQQAKRIADEHDFQRVLIVTEPLHMKRSMAIARGLGLVAAPAPTAESPRSGQWRQAWMLARETFFLGRFYAEHYAAQLLEQPAPDKAATKAAL